MMDWTELWEMIQSQDVVLEPNSALNFKSAKTTALI